MNKIVLITGATAGIGKACAEKYALQDIILSSQAEGLSG